MVSTRYQVTRFGSGFLGPGQPTVDEAMELAREKLSKIDGQYHFRGDDEHRLGRPEILRTLEERVSAGAIGEKFVVMGSNYDQPGGWPHADDITMVVDEDMPIGARPSRGGVVIFEREPERQWLVEYGRLAS
jgi:hypothetical protein